jgi:DNA-binding transcriptional regulator YiaG
MSGRRDNLRSTLPRAQEIVPGRRIRFLRTSCSLTQRHLARLLDISSAQLSRLERGEINIPEHVAVLMEHLFSEDTRRRQKSNRDS